MDFDALVLLKDVLISNDVKDTDIMQLKSAINNRNIDISQSISSNLSFIFSAYISETEFYIYLAKFKNCDQELLDTPIYLFFLRDACYYPLLLDALVGKYFSDEVIAQIIDSGFEKLASLDGDEYLEVALFIRDFITLKKSYYYKYIGNHQLIINYICCNIDCLTNDHDSECLFDEVNKDIILKLFSYGYIRLTEIFNYSNELLSKLICGLLDNKDFSYILAIINERSVDEETSIELQAIIEFYLRSTGSEERLIEIILDKLRSTKKTMNY